PARNLLPKDGCQREWIRARSAHDERRRSFRLHRTLRIGRQERNICYRHHGLADVVVTGITNQAGNFVANPPSCRLHFLEGFSEWILAVEVLLCESLVDDRNA